MKSSATHARRWPRPALIGGITGSLFVAATVAASATGVMSTAALPLPQEAGRDLSIVETTSGTTCDTFAASATCTAVNDYSTRPIARGQSGSITLTFENTGTVPAAASLLSLGHLTDVDGSPPPTARDYSPLHVSFFKLSNNRRTVIFSGPLDRFTRAIPLGGLAPRGSATFTFIVSNPLTSHSDAPRLSQSMQWQFVE